MADDIEMQESAPDARVEPPVSGTVFDDAARDATAAAAAPIGTLPPARAGTSPNAGSNRAESNKSVSDQ